ncbi:MAG: glycosyltransferase family 4 protein [Candidatus Bathyarchaeia archaeon]
MISGLARGTGGVERVVNELTNFLVNHGENVTIFGRNNVDFVQTAGNHQTIGLSPYNILPRRLRIAYYDKLTYSFKVWRRMKLYEPFHIVHGHGDNCLFPSLFRNVQPFLMTFHGVLAKYVGQRDPRIWSIVYAEKTAASRCDLAVACSEAVKNELVVYYGINPDKIVVIHNGVDANKFVPMNKCKARKRLRLPEKGKYAIWVGGSAKRKGLHIAIKAVEASPCKLLVVGTDGKNTGNVVFLGKIPDSDLLTAYSAADLFLFPTEYEGFPAAPLEALACGLPIIVSKESNMGEIIREGVHGFIIDDANPSVYREKIMLLLNDETMRREMSDNCRNLGKQYDWSKQAAKYWVIYKRLAEKNGTPK